MHILRKVKFDSDEYVKVVQKLENGQTDRFSVDVTTDVCYDFVRMFL